MRVGPEREGVLALPHQVLPPLGVEGALLRPHQHVQPRDRVLAARRCLLREHGGEHRRHRLLQLLSDAEQRVRAHDGVGRAVLSAAYLGFGAGLLGSWRLRGDAILGFAPARRRNRTSVGW